MEVPSLNTLVMPLRTLTDVLEAVEMAPNYTRSFIGQELGLLHSDISKPYFSVEVKEVTHSLDPGRQTTFPHNL